MTTRDLKPGDLIKARFSGSVGKFARYENKIGVVTKCYKVRRYVIQWQDKEEPEYGWSEFDLKTIEPNPHPETCPCEPCIDTSNQQLPDIENDISGV